MALFQPFDSDEIEFINKIREKNDKTEEFLKSTRDRLEEQCKPLHDSTKYIFSLDNAKNIMEMQLTALAFRQNIAEDMSFYLNKRSKEDVKMKKIRQDKYLWYAMGSAYKPKSLSESTILVDAHIAEMQRSIELIETHIEFLRTTAKNLDSLGYAIKNMVEFYNYLVKN